MSNLKVGMPALMEFDSIKENYELAKELNLDFLELNINMSYCFPKPECRIQLRKFKDESDIDFTLHYYDTVDVATPNENYQEYLYKDMEQLASNLDGIIDRLVLHLEPGAFMTIHSEKRYVYKYDKSYESRTVDILSKIRDILKSHNIMLVLENVPIHPFMENLYKVLGENSFNFCWDIGHDRIYNNLLFSSFKEKYNLQVKHMHMHNVNNMKDHQELALGQLEIEKYIDFANNNDIHVVIEVKDSINLKRSVDYFNNYQESIN
ncbi:MAG: Xylose isomerase-like TIM barrel [Candidatus Izimaplasma bacterium HR2]|nr:MAG: Xylose isomerase-like TIM barrel [Candidatus Izimaplasma bacterium HR2]